jgi:hypothetical protein
MRHWLLVIALAGCADAEFEDQDVEVDLEDDGKADATTEIRVRTGETSVWMTKEIARRETPEGPLLVLRGRASRNVTDGMGFVFDDPFGDFATRTVRTFEVTWPLSTARTLVDGVDQFVRIDFTPSADRPASLTARVVARPRAREFTGSSSIYLTAELTPVVVEGTVVYRLRGSTTAPIQKLEVTVDGKVIVAGRPDPTHFFIDLAPDLAFAIAGTSTPLAINARLSNGHVGSKQAKLGVAIKKLGITAGDAYDKWPRPSCEGASEPKTCLEALPDGALDLGSCGEAFVVQQCAGRLGVFVDDVAFQAASADGAARTAAPAFLADATGLVGAARKDAFAFGAQQTVESRLEKLFGRWLLSKTARTTILTRAVDGGILEAYTRPLDLVEPTAPQPGNATVTRNVAADALLVELTKFDFINSEFARTYDQLVAQFRNQHVAAIRAFRESIDIQPHHTLPDHDVLVGNWLDPLVEISVDRATGEATGVFIEID